MMFSSRWHPAGKIPGVCGGGICRAGGGSGASCADSGRWFGSGRSVRIADAGGLAGGRFVRIGKWLGAIGV